MRLYVFGIQGQIARSLQDASRNDTSITINLGGRPQVDLAYPEQIEQALRDFSPDVVINPAAYTAVDRAESEPELAFAINRDGARHVAAVTRDLDIPIIHLSTDYVFDGSKDGFYNETDAPAPLGIYGQSKLEGELAVAAANSRHLILRTAWVYSPYGSNFVRTMLRLSMNMDRLRVVDDQVGCPTYAADIAAAILTIAKRIKRSGWSHDLAGVTHIAGPNELSWCGFARLIMEQLANMQKRSVPVESIASKDFPTLAMRPANSRLSCDRLASVFGIRMPPTDRSLRECLKLLGH